MADLTAEQWRKAQYGLEVLSRVGVTVFAVSAEQLDKMLDKYHLYKQLVSQPLPVTLVSKLASVVVHADELFSTDGRKVFDEAALLTAARDPEVQAWIKSLGALAPIKRIK